ncbi:MAG: hypothetical protein ACYS0G_02930 [Planctomycetota bacterium]|jgi:hypothetical protein
MRPIHRTFLVVLVGLTGTARAAGQTGALEPIDQAVADLNTLSESLRQLELGLYQPAGFGRVYRVPGRDDRFMRVDGGLFAVFPQSAYARDRSGLRPVIPCDTVFYIGPPTLEAARPLDAPRETGAAAVPTPLDWRISLKIDPQPTGGTADGSRQLARRQAPGRPLATADARPARIVVDAGYRAARLRALMQRAASAHVTRIHRREKRD